MVVVLPDPLTPITKMTWGGEGIDFKRLGDRTQHRRNLLGHDPAQFVGAVRGNVAAFGQAIADTRRHAGAKVGGDQRFLDPVEVVFVEA